LEPIGSVRKIESMIIGLERASPLTRRFSLKKYIFCGIASATKAVVERKRNIFFAQSRLPFLSNFARNPPRGTLVVPKKASFELMPDI
jgi:hypothetical protein